MKVMRVHFLKTICLIFLVFALVVAVHAEVAVSGPQIIIDERTFDFGAIKEGVSIEHSFKVLNKGDQVLEIEKVKPA